MGETIVFIFSFCLPFLWEVGKGREGERPHPASQALSALESEREPAVSPGPEAEQAPRVLLSGFDSSEMLSVSPR